MILRNGRPISQEEHDDPKRHDAKMQQLASGFGLPLGYLAGPIGSDPSKWDGIIHHAAHLAAQLTDRYGVELIVPQLSIAAERLVSRSTAEYLRLDGALISKCDFLFRIEGYSPGAAAECEIAARLGIPVFTTEEQLASWLTNSAIDSVTRCDV